MRDFYSKYDHYDATDDDVHLLHLKSKRAEPVMNPPMSRMEFEDEISSKFSGVMDAREKRGFLAFGMAFFEDKSIPDVARSLGIDEDTCRSEIGRFCNMMAWLMPPSACGEMMPSMSASLRCAINDTAGYQKRRDGAYRAPTCGGSMTYYVPKRISRTSSLLIEDAVKNGAIRAMIRNASRTLGLDEAEQAARIALAEAFDRYDPQRGTLEAFLKLCVRKRLFVAVRAERVLVQRRACVQSMDAPTVTSAPFGSLLADRRSWARKSDSMEDLKRVSVAALTLTPLEMRVLRERVNGRSYAEIGRKMGKNPKVIDNALCRIYRKFETNGRKSTAKR